MSVVGTVVGQFTIRKNSALKPTTVGARWTCRQVEGRSGLGERGQPHHLTCPDQHHHRHDAEGDIETIKTQTVTCRRRHTCCQRRQWHPTSTAQTGDYARLAPAGLSVSTDITLVGSRTPGYISAQTGDRRGSGQHRGQRDHGIGPSQPGAITATKVRGGTDRRARGAGDPATPCGQVFSELTAVAQARPGGVDAVMLGFRRDRNKRRRTDPRAQDGQRFHNSAGTAIIGDDQRCCRRVLKEVRMTDRHHPRNRRRVQPGRWRIWRGWRARRAPGRRNHHQPRTSAGGHGSPRWTPGARDRLSITAAASRHDRGHGADQWRNGRSAPWPG